MHKDELTTLVKHHITDALGYLGDELSNEREEALDFYYGRPLGDEQEGRSRVVSRDVAEIVEWIMPSLMRIFASGDYVRFDPVGPEDEEQAEQETAYVGHVLHNDNNGFQILHDWFKDALLLKTGIVTWWWDRRITTGFERYSGLTDEEFTAIVGEEGVGVSKHEERVEPVPPEEIAAQVAQHQQMMLAGVRGVSPIAETRTVHDVVIKREKSDDGLKIYVVPPEEFLIERFARDLESARFVAHRQRLTRSDLREMGVSEVVLESISFAQREEADSDRDNEVIARDKYNETDTAAQEVVDEAVQTVWAYNCTMRVDEDGDGYAELRNILYCQGHILRDEYATEVRYAAICPVPTPHRFYGQSAADLVLDIQRIKTALWRQTMDNMYLANNPQKEVVEGQVNLDDLLTPRVGGLVRVKARGMVNPIVQQNFIPHSLQMLEYTDTVRESRTGVTRYNQGLDADSLNKTAGGINQIIGQAQQRIEMIARIFAETGVKRLMRGIHGELLRNQNKPAVVRLRNRYVPVAPTEWRERNNLSVTVGIGSGNKEQQLKSLMVVGDIMLKATKEVGAPVTVPANWYKFGVKAAELAGVGDGEEFFTDPAKIPPSPPPPDPVQINAQTTLVATKMMADQKDIESRRKAEVDAANAQRDAELEVREHDLKRYEFDKKYEIDRAKLAQERELELAKLSTQHRIAIEVERIRQEGENARSERDREASREIASKVGGE